MKTKSFSFTGGTDGHVGYDALGNKTGDSGLNAVYYDKMYAKNMQGIDQSKLVPLLTGALQEAITKIETLETKVAALEG